MYEQHWIVERLVLLQEASMWGHLWKMSTQFGQVTRIILSVDLTKS